MSELREIDDIQINEDMPFLRREWRAQRIGWIGMAIIIALALLGLFGRGPISNAEQGNRGSFAIEYDRIIRHGAQTEIAFHVAAGLQADSALRLYISQDYLRHFKVDNIVPEPTGAGTAGTLVYYEFARPNPRQPGRIAFSLTPVGYWAHSATAALSSATVLRFRQFVLP